MKIHYFLAVLLVGCATTFPPPPLPPSVKRITSTPTSPPMPKFVKGVKSVAPRVVSPTKAQMSATTVTSLVETPFGLRPMVVTYWLSASNTNRIKPRVVGAMKTSRTKTVAPNAPYAFEQYPDYEPLTGKNYLISNWEGIPTGSNYVVQATSTLGVAASWFTITHGTWQGPPTGLYGIVVEILPPPSWNNLRIVLQ